MRPERRRPPFRFAMLALLFLAAPTAGDIGSCNQPVTDLDPVKFFAAKQNLDCNMCLACNFMTHACDLACGSAAVGGKFPPGCDPLEHDGEVCLDALEATGCADYASFVADQGATTPTECDFCPQRDAGAAG
jgi:hypothetical protein